jgi:hypothetical protein
MLGIFSLGPYRSNIISTLPEAHKELYYLNLQKSLSFKVVLLVKILL